MNWSNGLVLDGRYELLRKLGAGGFGEVWLALDRNDQQHVAIKRLLHVDEEHLHRFIREAINLWRLSDQPAVVRILHHELDLPSPYIVMEYCSGGSLRASANRANPWREVAWMLRVVGGVLAAIHQQGGFHRDVKPDNLLLPTPGASLSAVRIGDFGIARVPTPSSNTVTRRPWGTEGYMAPELTRGEAMTAACDVYSLGVTALELLTGGRVLAALNVATAPAELKRLVLAMLDTDPARRPRMATVAERTLVMLMPAPPPVQPQPIVAHVPRREGGFLKILAGVAGAAAFGLGAAMALQAVADGGSEYDPSVDRYRGPDGRFRRGR